MFSDLARATRLPVEQILNNESTQNFEAVPFFECAEESKARKSYVYTEYYRPTQLQLTHQYIDSEC